MVSNKTRVSPATQCSLQSGLACYNTTNVRSNQSPHEINMCSDVIYPHTCRVSSVRWVRLAAPDQAAAFPASRAEPAAPRGTWPASPRAAPGAGDLAPGPLLGDHLKSLLCLYLCYHFSIMKANVKIKMIWKISFWLWHWLFMHWRRCCSVYFRKSIWCLQEILII